MLRLPKFELFEPRTVAEAARLLAEHPLARVVAGGTDLLVNMKHEIETPSVLVSLERVAGLAGVRPMADGRIEIGAMTRLSAVAADQRLRRSHPALAQAASLVAGPQLRDMGTLGGNVLLDTRCQWINQSHFWRQALGFCLKKDGTKCHVVEGGSKCVAAASNDTAPALMGLDATLRFASARGERVVPIDELWLADGIRNKKLPHDEILVAIELPPTPSGHRGAYGKLRERGSIDFPLWGVAARLDLEGTKVARAELCCVALQARPLRLPKCSELLVGVDTASGAWNEAVEACAAMARKLCHPMPNIPGDHEWRREMVPVYARRTIEAALHGAGPVHHV
jgi:4-hydroxybenzoyl-CoA reductase subunit beta